MPTAPLPAFFFQFRRQTGRKSGALPRLRGRGEQGEDPVACVGSALSCTRKSRSCIIESSQNKGLPHDSPLLTTAAQARQRFASGDPLKVVLLIEGIDLFAGRRDLLAKLFVISLDFLIGKVRFSRVPRLPVLIEKA